MKRISLLWIIPFCLVVLISFYFGGVYGFSIGFAGSIGASAPSDATIISQTLKRLHNNEVESATELLETHLDSKILEHFITVAKGHDSIFNILEPGRSFYDVKGNSFKLMQQAANYRQNNEQINDDAKTSAMIKEAVRYYLSK